MEVETEAEVAIVITITVAMHQPSRRRCTTVNHRHRIATGAVDFLMIIRMDRHRTPLGRLQHTNTGRDTDRAVLVHTHRSPRTAETLLTQMVVGETHRGRWLARMVEADITLDRRAEAVTVGVEVEVEDIMAAAAAVGVEVVVVGVMVMETAEEGSATPHHIRTTTMSMTVATAQAAVARLEGAVGVEVSNFWLSFGLGHGHYYVYSRFSYSLLFICLHSSGFVFTSQSDIRKRYAKALMLVISMISRVQISVTYSVGLIPRVLVAKRKKK